MTMVLLKFAKQHEEKTFLNHRCTVVENPGGSLGFWLNSFEGDTWGCQTI
jgi:hypothetical protein